MRVEAVTGDSRANAAPASPPHAAAAPHVARRCHNCGADAPLNYCPNCGQETQIALPSAFAFLRDAAGRYIRFDGRMWRSLVALLFRPGFLTREYLAGRRRRYVRAARLFVALSIVFFFVLKLSSGSTGLIVVHPGSDAEGKPGVEHSVAGRSRLGFDIDPDLNLTIDADDPRWLAPLRARVDAFNQLPRAAKTEQIVAGMFRYAPYAAIGLLPLFALMLEGVYAGGRRRHPARPRRYAAHLVYGAHMHAFAFLVATMFALVPFAPIRALLGVWAFAYALLSLRAVYGGSWVGIVLRATAVAIVYLVLFALAVAALVVAAVMLR